MTVVEKLCNKLYTLNKGFSPSFRLNGTKKSAKKWQITRQVVLCARKRLLFLMIVFLVYFLQPPKRPTSIQTRGSFWLWINWFCFLLIWYFLSFPLSAPFTIFSRSNTILFNFICRICTVYQGLVFASSKAWGFGEGFLKSRLLYLTSWVIWRPRWLAVEWP